MTREMLQIIGNNQSQGQSTSLQDLYNFLGDFRRDDIRRQAKNLEGRGMLEWTDTGLKMTLEGFIFYDTCKD